MSTKSAALRALLKAGTFLYMPSCATPIEGRLAEAAGCKAMYVGGYATGASLATTEPLLTMDEQVAVAGAVARAISVPLIADAGAGFGEPLHTMRTMREFITAGVAGIHLEDQLYPKRAHYHKYQVHAVPVPEFVDKVRWACRERDRTDPDFVIIARTDTCREFGLDEAIPRINAAAEVGADMGLLFPRSPEEAAEAPKRAKVPLVYVQSRGNRDGRPLFAMQELQAMGYAGCIDAQIMIGTGVHFMQRAVAEVLATGRYTAITDEEFRALRKTIEDLIGLDEHYAIEAATVEK